MKDLKKELKLKLTELPSADNVMAIYEKDIQKMLSN